MHYELIAGLLDFFKIYGVARTLHLDAGPQSKSKVLKDFLEKNSMQLVVSPSNAHFSSGLVESHCKRTVSALRYLIDNKKPRLLSWHTFLPVITFHLNNSPGIALKVSANEIVFGQRLEEPAVIRTVLPTSKTLAERLAMLKSIREGIKIARRKSRDQFKEKYDKNRLDVHFAINQPVFVQMERKATKDNPQKFQPRFRLGVITQKISRLVYLVRLQTAKGKVFHRKTHVAHMKALPG